MPASGPSPRHARRRGDLVLVATDDIDLRLLLCDQLDAHGYRGVVADSGRAEYLADQLRPAVVVVDLDSPDGTSAAARIRRHASSPVIAIGAGRAGEKRALEVGADGYLAKPFEWKELLARVRAALRRMRAAAIPGRTVAIGPIRIDASRGRVTVRGRVVHLTGLELRLLELLARFAGRVVKREHLIQELWPGTPAHGDPLRFHVAALRKKIEDDPARPRWLITVLRVGYRLGARAGKGNAAIRRA